MMNQRRSLDDFKRQLDDFKARIHRLAETTVVPFEELFPPEFMAHHTTYPTVQAFLGAVGIKTERDLKAVESETLDAHVRASSSFASFHEMAQAALPTWAKRQLERSA
jgi:hypothetical protein